MFVFVPGDRLKSTLYWQKIGVTNPTFNFQLSEAEGSGTLVFVQVNRTQVLTWPAKNKRHKTPIFNILKVLERLCLSELII